jgi:hypothetical protein
MAGKDWRKRVLDKRPKTPQPKTTFGESAPTDGTDKDKESLRPRNLDKLAWRKTYHDNRPPMTASSLAPPSRDDIDDARSDAGSEASTPRRRSGPKPKLTRLISDYLSLTPHKVEFTEFWKEDAPLVIEPPIDPLNVVVAVRSAIHSYQPVSAEYNSGLLRVFEDYRRVRDEKEKLDGLLKETLDDYSLSEETWTAKEGHYQDEIRRLELIIARGTTGLSGLMRARQGTMVDRKRTRRRAISTDKAETAFEFLTREQIDEGIRSRSQKGKALPESQLGHDLVLIVDSCIPPSFLPIRDDGRSLKTIRLRGCIREPCSRYSPNPAPPTDSLAKGQE